MRQLISPTTGNVVVGTLQSYEGGLGVTTPAAVKTALGALDTSTINQPSGVLGLNEDGVIPPSLIPDDGVVQVAVIGPKEIFVGLSAVYQISNYDMFTDYTLTAVNGSVSRVKDVITYVAPAIVMPGGFILNGRVISPLIKPPGPSKPSITSPTNNAAAIASSYTLTSNAFVQNGDSSVHSTSDWQISTDPNFVTVPISSIDSAVNKLSFSVSGLVASTSYYARVRYKASNGNYSEWSDTITFTTASIFVYNHVISANVTNFNMKTTAIANGWNQVAPLRMTVTVNAGILVGSTSSAAFAFDTDTGYPVGSELSLINNGKILGKGGNGGAIGTAGSPGGPALKAQTVLAVTNNNIIGGGGGGGGGGSRGASGGGQGYIGGTGYQNGTDLAPGGGQSASAGTGQPGASLGQTGATGGTDEGPASVGSVPYGQPGGIGGNAVQGNVNIAWLAIGTRLGAIV